MRRRRVHHAARRSGGRVAARGACAAAIDASGRVSPQHVGRQLDTPRFAFGGVVRGGARWAPRTRGPVITAIKAKRVECFAKFCARRQPWTENARSRDGRPPFWERPGRALPNPEEYPVPRN